MIQQLKKRGVWLVAFEDAPEPAFCNYLRLMFFFVVSLYVSFRSSTCIFLLTFSNLEMLIFFNKWWAELRMTSVTLSNCCGPDRQFQITLVAARMDRVFLDTSNSSVQFRAHLFFFFLLQDNFKQIIMWTPCFISVKLRIARQHLSVTYWNSKLICVRL